MQGVFLDDHTVSRDSTDLAPLHTVLPGLSCAGLTATEQTAGRIRDAEVVITNKVVLDRDALAGAARLRLVCIAATGTDNVDLDASRDYGITVCNVRGYATASVVEHVFMVMLALTHRLNDHSEAVRLGVWSRSPTFSLLDYPFRELAGMTLGIIGYGELGRSVATVARAFGMQILLAQRPGSVPAPGRRSLQDLLAESDVVSLHCPLTAATRHLIGAQELQTMRRSAILINTARGGIVHEQALADALRGGVIAGAAVDVLNGEPPAPDNPLLAGDIPNLIVTPHTAWAGTGSRRQLIRELAENIRAYCAGTPRNVVSS